MVVIHPQMNILDKLGMNEILTLLKSKVTEKCIVQEYN